MAEAEPLLLRVDQAEPRYNEAVAIAVAACAADTVGQTCYICLGPGDEEEGLVRMCACRGTAGFAHVSCLARGAQAAVERGAQRGWKRWRTCGLCEQKYHGVVACALGWACWKTYLGRPEMGWIRQGAMNLLGNGLFAAEQIEDALNVEEARLSSMRRLGDSEHNILIAQGNIANSYEALGRNEEAGHLRQDVYFRRLRLNGEEHRETLVEANNYALSLLKVSRFIASKSLLRETIPVARRVLGERNDTTLKMRLHYAAVLYKNHGATLDDLREAVTTLEDIEGVARRVLGGAHPVTANIECYLRKARAALRAREGAAPDDVSSVREGVAAVTPPGGA